jgi:phage shock protein PspC (stress-responsive transcriptional regulator)
MNKVITINLNGNAYQVEERGYQLLCDYLDGAEAQLKGNPDRAEIISDLEQAIADKCRNFLGPQKNIVTAAEIEQIIKAMGPVDSEGSEGGDTGRAGQAQTGRSQSDQKTGSGGSAKSEQQARKRFYRIREGKQIEGVCTGLAALSGFDVSLIRSVFVVLAIVSGGIFCLVYLLAAIVFPYAETSEEHAAAFGTTFNAQDFINQAKEHYSEFKKEGEDWKNRAKEKQYEWQRSWRRSMRRRRNWWGLPPMSPLPPLVGATLPIFGLLIGVLTLIWIFAVISVINTHAIFGWPLPFRFPIWVAIVILVILLNVVIGPFKYMRNAQYSHPFGPVVAIWTSMAWMAFLVFLAWLAYQHSSELQNFVQNLPNVWNEMMNR